MMAQMIVTHPMTVLLEVNASVLDKEDNNSQNGGNDHTNDKGDQIHAI